MTQKKIMFIILAFWTLVVAVWVLKSEYTMITGREVLLRTVPVDPSDLFMGDYVILNYEVGQFPKYSRVKYEKNKTVYVSLFLDKDNVARLKYISEEKPKDNLFLKGKLKDCNTVFLFSKNGSCIQYGIESYYVKENKGHDLERDLRNGALVKVLIDKNGEAKVKGFLK